MQSSLTGHSLVFSLDTSPSIMSLSETAPLTISTASVGSSLPAHLRIAILFLSQAKAMDSENASSPDASGAETSVLTTVFITVTANTICQRKENLSFLIMMRKNLLYSL